MTSCPLRHSLSFSLGIKFVSFLALLDFLDSQVYTPSHPPNQRKIDYKFLKKKVCLFVRINEYSDLGELPSRFYYWLMDGDSGKGFWLGEILVKACCVYASCLYIYGGNDIFKIFRQYVVLRQKWKPKWRKNKICFIKTYLD